MRDYEELAKRVESSINMNMIKIIGSVDAVHENYQFLSFLKMCESSDAAIILKPDRYELIIHITDDFVNVALLCKESGIEYGGQSVVTSRAIIAALIRMKASEVNS